MTIDGFHSSYQSSHDTTADDKNVYMDISEKKYSGHENASACIAPWNTDKYTSTNSSLLHGVRSGIRTHAHYDT